MSADQTQNSRGEWVPAIPLPMFVGFGLRLSECQCGRTFRKQIDYRQHYAYVHVMGMDA